MIGALNPLPHRVGGGLTPAARAYRTLRQAVGTGGSASNERGIEGLWRRSEAKGLAAATSHTRRAISQAFPYLATDLLSYYERILGLVPETDSTEAARRSEVTTLWTRPRDVTTAALLAELQKIDSRLSLIETSHDQAASAQFGRAFAAHDILLEGPAWGLTRPHAHAPNYSTDMVVRVLFSVGHTGPLVPGELVVVERVRRLMRSLLPSDTDFTIAADGGLGGTPGLWRLGSTPIGFGGLG